MSSIMTHSGRYFDIYDPSPDAVDLADIDWALARECRFACHHDAPYEVHGPLTTAAHSVRVARLGWCLWHEIVESGLCSADADVVVAARERVEFALALLLHDAPEAYLRDKPGPQKTEEDERIESGVLAAVLDAVADNHAQAHRLHAWIDSPARKFVDRLACAQEALLFQRGGADWALPPETASGLGVTRSLIAETLPQFWPRRRERLLDAVLDVRAASRRIRAHNIDTRMHEVATATALGVWIPIS